MQSLGEGAFFDGRAPNEGQGTMACSFESTHQGAWLQCHKRDAWGLEQPQANQLEQAPNF